MDLIKGLESGFFHTWETGVSAYRIKIFKKEYKEHVDAGKFIRDIQNAPRDARYKIDHYYNPDTTENDSIPYPYLNFHADLLKYMNIDESFNWKKELKDSCSEYTYNDISIGYDYFDPPQCQFSTKKANKLGRYYFKYKGEINKLDFTSSPKIALVDYTKKIWSDNEGEIVWYKDVHTLLHNLRYFLVYKNITYR